MYIPIDEHFNEEACRQFFQKHNIAVKAPTDPEYFTDVFWDRTRKRSYNYEGRIITNVSRHDRHIRSFVSIRTPTPEDLENMRQLGVYYPHTLGRFGNE